MVGYGTAIETILVYGLESTFGGGATTKNKIFFGDQTITGLTLSKNLELLRAFGDRGLYKTVPKQFIGSMTIEGTLTNAWFLRLLMGTVTTTGAIAPYTHTFTESEILASMGIDIGLKLLNEERAFHIVGAVINTFSITARVNELAKCRLEILFKDITDDASMPTAQVETFEPYAFNHGSLEIPTGTSVADVQTFDLTINNNQYSQYALGNQKVQRFIKQAFDVTATLSLLMKDRTYYNKLLGETVDASLKLKFLRGTEGASSEASIHFNGTNVGWNEESLPINLNEPIIEEFDLFIYTLEAIAKNSTSAYP